ncbi:rod shape-determining protein MreD [Bacillus licheniformis]|nr:rod shape-determining protein MreD [Bacillus licheniformis]
MKTQKQQYVTIKGTKNGLTLHLDDTCSFEELLYGLQDMLSLEHYIFISLLAVCVLEFYQYGVQMLIRPEIMPFHQFVLGRLLPTLALNAVGGLLLIYPFKWFFTSLKKEQRFLLLVLVFMTAYVNQPFAITYGFIFGLLYDINYTDLLGVYMFGFAGICYLSSKAFKVLQTNALVGYV